MRKDAAELHAWAIGWRYIGHGELLGELLWWNDGTEGGCRKKMASSARQARAKRPGEASSCFAMPSRASACPCMETRREGGGDRRQAGEADRQVGDASARFMTETFSFSSLDLLIPWNNSKNFFNESCSP